MKYLILQKKEDFHTQLYFLFFLLRQSPDVCHFHFAHTGVFGTFLKEAGIPIKMVTSFHGYDVNQLPTQKGSEYYKRLFLLGDHFIANTQFTATQAMQLGCCGGKISVIPVGLYTDIYPFRKRTLDKKTIQILTVGRLVEKKGYAYSIRAIAKLVERKLPVFYTIIGDGPCAKELEEMVSSLGIASNVRFLGDQTQDQVIERYNHSHIFILPSVTAHDGDKEGQALVIQEAQACGLPVISTYHNGIPEGMIEGKTGYLVPEKDSDALAGAIEGLLERCSSWPEMGLHGREFVESKYDMKVIIPQLVQVYEGIKKTPSE